MDSPVRVYFDANREQVVSGVRYAPIGHPYKMWIAKGYTIQTQVEIIKPIPKHWVVRIVPNEGVVIGGMNIMSSLVLPGFKGELNITVGMINNMELRDMCAIGYLMFEGESKPQPKPKPKSKPQPKPQPELQSKPKPQPKKKTTTAKGKGKVKGGKPDANKKAKK
jgi:hypothetical protein